MTLNVPFEFTHSVINFVPDSYRVYYKKNIFPPGGRASLKGSQFEQFIKDFYNSIIDINCCKRNPKTGRLDELLEKVLEPSKTIQTLYCKITPTNVVEFRLDRQITYGIMIYLYTLALGMIYRDNSKFVFNGISTLEMHQEFYVCEFKYDSLD
jgi:hypothetical protein